MHSGRRVSDPMSIYVKEITSIVSARSLESIDVNIYSCDYALEQKEQAHAYANSHVFYAIFYKWSIMYNT